VLTWNVNQPGHTQIQIYDASGRIVTEQQQVSAGSGQQRISFSLAQLDAGIYFMRISQNGKATVAKLIRE
jgi:hypothetical protein